MTEQDIEKMLNICMTNMATTINQEVEILRDVTKIAKDKKQAVINRDRDGLNSAISREQEALTVLNELEKRKASNKKDLQNLLSTYGNDFNMKEVCGHGEAKTGNQQLQASKTDLLDITDEFRRVNDENRILIQNQLRINGKIINDIVSVSGMDPSEVDKLLQNDSLIDTFA